MSAIDQRDDEHLLAVEHGVGDRRDRQADDQRDDRQRAGERAAGERRPTHQRRATEPERAALAEGAGDLLLERLEEPGAGEEHQRPQDGQRAEPVAAELPPGEREEEVRGDAGDDEPRGNGGASCREGAARLKPLTQPAHQRLAFFFGRVGRLKPSASATSVRTPNPVPPFRT